MLGVTWNNTSDVNVRHVTHNRVLNGPAFVGFVEALSGVGYIACWHSDQFVIHKQPSGNWTTIVVAVEAAITVYTILP